MMPDGPPNLALVLCTAGEIASGMAHLHSRGIVHGDLSSGITSIPLVRCFWAYQELSAGLSHTVLKLGSCIMHPHGTRNLSHIAQQDLCLTAFFPEVSGEDRQTSVSSSACSTVLWTASKGVLWVCRQRAADIMRDQPARLLRKGIRLWAGARHGGGEPCGDKNDRHSDTHATRSPQPWHHQQGTLPLLCSKQCMLHVSIANEQCCQ